MTQYVIQIQIAENGVKVGWLAKSFEVTEKCPIPVFVPPGRKQKIMTNTVSFGGTEGIIATYKKYTTQLFFSYQEEAGTISCSGPVDKTWDMN